MKVLAMSDLAVTAETDNEATQNQRIFMQLGMFGLLFLGLALIADVAPAHGSCSGIVTLSGPLLPEVA